MPACQDPNYQNYTYAILDLLNFRQMILNIIESDTEKRILLILFMQVNQLLIVFRLQNILNIPLNMLSFVQNLHINQG